MSGYLVENNVYSPAISKVDTNNDEANLQLANRTRYLNNALNGLQNYLSTVKDDTDYQIEQLTKRINQIKAVIGEGSSSTSISTSDDVVRAVNKLLNDVSNLETLLQNHTHNYAGSLKPAGPANEVSVTDDTVNRLSLLGTDNSHPTVIKRNPQIYIEENDIHAERFHGYLDGEAAAAESLSHEPNITLSGDIRGSAAFTGSNDVNIVTSLQEQNISPGEYGESRNYTLDIDGSVVIPSITVNSAGIITRIQNRVVALPSNLGTNNTISAQQDTRKIYMIGASSQGRYASTYSQIGVYAKSNYLYSNNDKVATLTEKQDLLNKTINGYIPNDAMEYTVDKTIGGTIDSNSLITSDAVARHTHSYASAKTPSGAAESVEITPAALDDSYRVVINKDNKLYVSSISIKNETLIGKSLMATENMYIPGGKIWIENVEPSTDSGGNLYPGDFLNPDDFVKRVSTEKLHEQETKCAAGQLLSYHSGGYLLADNSSKTTCRNLAIALDDSQEKVMDVMILGAYNLGTDYYDGAEAYVGKNGDIVYGKPQGNEIIIRKVGYVRRNYLIFNPENEATAERLDALERALQRIFYDNNNYAWQMDAMRNFIPRIDAESDNMWEVDDQGDIMPSAYCTGNDYWELSDSYSMMPREFADEEFMSTFELDAFGNLVPKQEYSFDSMFECDERDDFMPAFDGIPNKTWVYDADNNIEPEIPFTTVFEEDNEKNLMPSATEVSDSMFDIDEDLDIMPAENGESNKNFEYDEDGNVISAVLDKTGFEYDSQGNLSPRRNYIHDTMFGEDERKDLAAFEEGEPNETWQYDKDANVQPALKDMVFEYDIDGNVMARNVYATDTMFEKDEKGDIAASDNGDSNKLWEYDRDANVEFADHTQEGFEYDNQGNVIPRKVYVRDSVFDQDEYTDIMPSDVSGESEIWKSDNKNIELKDFGD